MVATGVGAGGVEPVVGTRPPGGPGSVGTGADPRTVAMVGELLRERMDAALGRTSARSWADQCRYWSKAERAASTAWTSACTT